MESSQSNIKRFISSSASGLNTEQHYLLAPLAQTIFWLQWNLLTKQNSLLPSLASPQGINCLLAPVESSQRDIKCQQTPNRAKLLAGSTGTSTWCNYLTAPMESSQSNINLHSTVNWLQETFHKLKQTCLLVPVPMDSIHSNTTCWLHWHLHRPLELLPGSNGIATQQSYLLAPLASPQGINYLLVPMESS